MAMTEPRRLSGGMRRTAEAVSHAEMMCAASDVIAARLRIIADGLADPGRADLREMSLMGTEKVEALSASAVAVARTLEEWGGRLGRSALAEVAHASNAASGMASAADPATLAGLQFHYALGWWSRVAAQSLSLNAALLQAQAEALTPLHAKAVANARRLRR